ncbi:hypothetical protein GYMLUDRAFT_235973 [Collybiopsis luxurians FD-317 M1]|nr:hypothetical protein GYMLUDRAFT_235973 [Collybiopsis luxurians FD-317 M1]
MSWCIRIFLLPASTLCTPCYVSLRRYGLKIAWQSSTYYKTIELELPLPPPYHSTPGQSSSLYRRLANLEANCKPCLDAQRPGQNVQVLLLGADITDAGAVASDLNQLGTPFSEWISGGILGPVASALKQVEDAFQRLGIVMSSAGLMENSQNTRDADPNEWWDIWTVDIGGFSSVTQAALSLLISSGDGLKLDYLARTFY